mmetsp:Transcript_12854/g.33361  ORF Transcript_12854/g.33361 Transcript_12854/m.33361 type:complete len:235 (-) Transcript_12854:145-849(-)
MVLPCTQSVFSMHNVADRGWLLLHLRHLLLLRRLAGLRKLLCPIEEAAANETLGVHIPHRIACLLEGRLQRLHVEMAARGGGIELCQVLLLTGLLHTLRALTQLCLGLAKAGGDGQHVLRVHSSTPRVGQQIVDSSHATRRTHLAVVQALLGCGARPPKTRGVPGDGLEVARLPSQVLEACQGTARTTTVGGRFYSPRAVPSRPQWPQQHGNLRRLGGHRGVHECLPWEHRGLA